MHLVWLASPSTHGKRVWRHSYNVFGRSGWSKRIIATHLLTPVNAILRNNPDYSDGKNFSVSAKQSLHETLRGPVSGMRSCLVVPDRKASKQLKMFLDVSAPNSLLSLAATDFLQSLHHPSVVAIAVVRVYL